MDKKYYIERLQFGSGIAIFNCSYLSYAQEISIEVSSNDGTLVTVYPIDVTTILTKYVKYLENMKIITNSFNFMLKEYPNRGYTLHQNQVINFYAD